MASPPVFYHEGFNHEVKKVNSNSKIRAEEENSLHSVHKFPPWIQKDVTIWITQLFSGELQNDI